MAHTDPGGLHAEQRARASEYNHRFQSLGHTDVRDHSGTLRRQSHRNSTARVGEGNDE